MTSLKESVRKAKSEETGWPSHWDKWAEGYIKQLQEYMETIPVMEWDEATKEGYIMSCKTVLRFLRGETK